jgi:putative peptidoglycan lipid II flippase
VLVGGILQLLVQIPPLLRLGLVLRFPRPIDMAGLREIGRLMLPRIFGAGITQINLVVDSQFAATLREGSVSFLYYAIRITELTLGVFAVSISTVILPRLARATAEGDRGEVAATLGTAARMLLFVTIPATFGLWILRVPIVHVLFERGEFTREDTLFTASALGWYGAGMLPVAAVSVLASAFYAHRDTRTPVQVGLLVFFVHLALNFALCGPMGHNGIALSTSISAVVNATLLAWLLNRHADRYLTRAVVSCLLRAGAAAFAMSVAVFYALRAADPVSFEGIVTKSLVLAALVAGGALIYLWVSWMLGSEEIRLLRSTMRRR